MVSAKKEYKKGLISKSEYEAIVEDSTDAIEEIWDRFQAEFELTIGQTCAFVTELFPSAFEN